MSGHTIVVTLANKYSSVCSCHLSLTSSASVRSSLYHAHPCMKCSLISPVFLKRSLVFPILCVFSHCSLKKAYLSLLAIPWSSAFSWVASFPFSSIFHFPSFFSYLESLLRQHLAFLHFFFMGVVLVTTSCTVLWISICSSSGTLSTRSNPLNLFVTSTVWS